MYDPSHGSRSSIGVQVAGGPFRGESARADQVARLLVEDALYVALAKGSITPEEGHRMWRYAMALGLSDDEFRTLTHRWLP